MNESHWPGKENYILLPGEDDTIAKLGQRMLNPELEPLKFRAKPIVSMTYEEIRGKGMGVRVNGVVVERPAPQPLVVEAPQPENLRNERQLRRRREVARVSIAHAT